MTPHSEQVVVATQRDLIELEAIRSVLRSSGVPFTVQGEHYYGVSGARAAIGDAVIRVIVPGPYADSARRAIMKHRRV